MSIAKRSIMTLYSGADDLYSHRVRIVLAEKNVAFDVIDVDNSVKAIEELASYNPYGTIPTLVDRDLVLYKSEIIMEYLDERFPHPPLMPVYPVAKGRYRLIMHRVNQDWYKLAESLINPNTPENSLGQIRKKLVDSITSASPVFAEKPFFASEEFSLIDCCLAPLFWRLPKLGLKLPEQAQPVLDYAERIFQRSSFQASLTDKERMMRK